MTFSLESKVALITGASSGLGEHFAQVLADAGASLVLAARRIEKLQAMAETFRDAGTRCVALQMDVTDSGAVKTAVEDARKQMDVIDVLVNNSGITINGPILEQSEADWDKVNDTNLKGAFLVAAEVARAMKDSGRGGSIINIASILGLRQAGLVTPYAVSKAGLIQLTKSMALELARYQIRVNAIAPGYFATDINKDVWDTPIGQALVKRIPQRRTGQLEDLDGPLLLLASDASTYMTGSVIAVDGGHLVNTL